MDIRRIIEASLNVPVIEPFSPLLPPCVTFNAVGEGAGLAGDGTETEEIEEYQVDVWDRDKDSVKAMAKQLNSDLMAADSHLTIPNIAYLYDNNGRVWRATLTFIVVGEE